jgi:hypothetical protein
MRYILVMQQYGEGCDYTIGCGIKYRIMTARTFEEAQLAAKKYIQEGYPVGEDIELARAYLSTLVGDELPLNEWYDEMRKENIEAKEQEIKKQELAELERLKAKYE